MPIKTKPNTPPPSSSKPPLSTHLNAHDFELSASKTLTPKTWSFYSSAATDLHTLKNNSSYLSRILLRPRILKDVSSISTSTHILGHLVSLPLFVSPAALAALVHPDGEIAMAKACASAGIPQIISTNASFPVDQIVAAGGPQHPFFFQLYVDKERKKSEALLDKVAALGVTAIFLTVDAPVPGKREADERVAADESVGAPMSGAAARNDKKGGGLGRVMGSYIDSSMSWADLPWLRRVWKGKIVLKGVQGAADAQRAAEAGIDGIVVSNHGGRSLDTSAPSVLVLLELQRCCPEVFEKLEVFVDGGIRRGTDVLKCLCLGATAVGMGRSPLYAVNYGQEGVEHLIDIMKDEIEVTMKMLGITDLSQCNPSLVNSLDIDHLVPTRLQHPYATARSKVWTRREKANL